MAKLLVIEDDEDLSETMCTWLRSKKHHVTPALSGIEAIELLRFGQFDLVLMDGRLPDMEGIEIAREYRAGGGTVPIVMITGSLDNSECQRAQSVGVDQFLRKPFNLDTLERLIKKYTQPTTV